MEISQSERLDQEIFDLVLTRGPITVYSASKESGISLTTIHRHFKQMEKEEEIKIYRTEPHQSGNPKKLYGPTNNGILGFCSEFEDIRKKFDSIFEKWLKEKPFVNDIIADFGFSEDFIKQNPRYVIQICKKFMRFYNDAFELANDEEFMDENIVDIGFLLLGKKNPKKYYEMTKELYETIPSFRNNLDGFFLVVFGVFLAMHGRKDIEKKLLAAYDAQENAAKIVSKKVSKSAL